MTAIQALKKIFGNTLPIIEKSSAEAYDIWSENYDSQPGNLMLDLDEIIFSELLAGTDMAGKQVADIGCGTGRHWPKLIQKKPMALTGFDVSEGMLKKLKLKFSGARVFQITDDLFPDVADKSFNTIISTLTVAHIGNIERALQAWNRMLRDEAEIIITDFHPDALAKGGKRTFEHNKRHIAVENFVHRVDAIEKILAGYGFTVVNRRQKIVDEWVKPYYTAKNALHVYQRFENCPIIYGLHFKRG